MGYAHIDNLYRNTAILLFKECYVLEKIHGTSAHVAVDAAGNLKLFSGEQQAQFEALFNQEELKAKLAALGGDVTIYGEAYGGKIQGMSARYGSTIKFVVFDVKRGKRWLCVPEAAGLVESVGLEFVWWARTQSDVTNLDGFRDMNSGQAARNGMGEHTAEGIVIKPLQEMHDFRGNRIIAKHKRDDFRETFQPRKVNAPIEVLRDAERIAHEWVTPMRLEHVIARTPNGTVIEGIKDVITNMLEDVLREGSGEFVETREARKAICAKTALMFKDRLKAGLNA